MPIIRLLQPGDVPVALLSNVPPSPLSGESNPGTSTYAARADHNHDDSELRGFVDAAVASVTNKAVKLEFEVDFGTALGQSSAKFSVPITGLLAGGAVSVTQSGNAPTDKSSDENEMDMFLCNGRCQVDGTLLLYVQSMFGPVTGKYKFIAVF